MYGNYGPTTNQRYAQLLARQNPNNGTNAGGLANVLNQFLLGRSLGQDRQQQTQANQALMQGLNPQMPEGQYGPPQPGSLQLAQQKLGGLEGNEYAGRMAQMLMMQDLDRQQKMAQMAQTQAFQEKLLGKKQGFEEKQGDLDRASREKVAKDRLGAAGKYYAVPTGNGYIMIDKGNGLAVRMGIGADGQLRQIGAPFRPTLDTAGQPTPIPQGAEMQGGVPTVTPPSMPQSAGNQPSPTGPLMPPSLAAGPQGDVAKAKAQAQFDVKREGESRDAAGAMTSQMAPLDRLEETVDEILTSPGLESRTGYSSYIPAPMQGQDAMNFEAKVKTLKSQISQNVLQMYRSMSQTGGAVGQVSNFEQEMFQNNLAALDQAQSMEEFQAQLRKIKEFVQGSKARMQQVYRLQFGRDLPQSEREAKPDPLGLR